MTLSSIKSLWQSKWLWACAGLCLATPAHAEDLHYEYRVRLEGRLGYHLLEPIDLATHRYVLEAEQKFKFDKWTAVATSRALVEAAYATNNTRYGASVRERDSSEVVVRDLYLQYQSDAWLVRLGNQQVVWGETFGFYFADIVNPKDFRELMLWDLEAQRLPVPMANVKYIAGKYSLQGIFIPKPFFNKMAAIGGDFDAVQSYLPGANLQVNDDRTIPWTLTNAEYGIRGTALIEGVDLSLFYFNYLDRMPHYTATITQLAPLAVRLDANHPRLQTFGWTGTVDLATFLLRWEAIYDKDRTFDVVQGTALSTDRSDEATLVLGIDYTQLENWRLGLQASETYVTRGIAGNLTPRERELLSLHVNGTPWKDHTIDMIFSYGPRDGSTLTQFKYTVPLSDQIETILAVDLLQGSPTSQFGQFKRGSRAYLLFKIFLNG